jgi:APA family basic amino acid/polyamine antiporter
MTANLRRRLGPFDAVVIGVGSMVGAGVFAVWAPAAASAGSWLLLGLVIAGVVALCNATSSAQLAARHPESGGTYVYARERISPFWGHVAGWGFVVGKTASCAAMATTAGAYLWPEQARWVASAAVVAILVVNLGGLERTVTVTRWLLIAAIASLAIVIASAVFAQDQSQRMIAPPVDTSALGVLRSAGLMFFAFAGYARIATLGEEVRDPERTIPWAVPRALIGVLVLYLIVGIVAIWRVPAGALAISGAPLATVLDGTTWSGVAWVVDIGAGIACLGVLLNLIPGVSRTMLAMSRRRELPTVLARVDSQRQLPVVAEVTVTVVVLVLVHTLTLTTSIAVSGVAVLTYYAITNAAALRLTSAERRWPRAIAWIGLTGCVVLVLALPTDALIGGLAVLAAGVIARQVAVRLSPA